MVTEGTDIKIVGCGFGNRYTDRTFSGVVRRLFGELEAMGLLAGYVSTKQLRFADVLDGMLDFGKVIKYGRPGISAKWLWRPKTVRKLTERFNRYLDRIPACSAVLQVGTHVLVHRPGVRHYCFTDMTVVQARRSPQAAAFSINKLSPQAAAEAIAMQKNIFHNCEAVFAVSHWTKDSIVTDYGVSESKVHAVLAGASLDNGQNIDGGKKEPRILFIGRDWERKGGGLLLEAFRIVREKIPSASLTIIGCAPKVDRDGVKVLGLLDKTVEAEKRIFHDELAMSSVLCVPSFFEPFGLCFAEAQYCGVPPVTFDGEGRRDTIIDGTTGLIVKERSSGALAEALIELLSNPERLETMGKAGRKFVEENLTWRCVADRVLRVINECERKYSNK